MSPPVALSGGDNELLTLDNRIRGGIAELEELSLLWRIAPTMPSLLHKTDTGVDETSYLRHHTQRVVKLTDTVNGLPPFRNGVAAPALLVLISINLGARLL